MRVVPLKKKEIYDHTTGNFRPIAILNGHAKVMETIVKREIDRYDYEYQHGFTKGKSTATAMARLI